MGAGRTEMISFKDAKVAYLNAKEDKFKLIGCPIKGIHCTNILPEINKLYAESELARENKEYQKSVEQLQKAYYRTLELKESPCTKCVSMFQSSINETLETMQEELYEMSFGIFHRKRYQLAYSKLSNFIKKLNIFKVEGNPVLTTKEVG
ncbi:hypothetical protein [Maribellus maritimus]|uniref:hypothetical protein n=1 Tax=Maribellus maritimus TaxID=2870838 RepID=UPI001EEC9EA8|nr:hypothetical protein [Maribellus maritimus]MCG6189882.1 hypothetical protein [Maribellus maritimus]